MNKLQLLLWCLACAACFIAGLQVPRNDASDASLQICEEMYNECYGDVLQACAPEMWPSVISRHGGLKMPWCEGYTVHGMEPAHEPSAEYIKGMVTHAAWALEHACYGCEEDREQP